MLNNSIRTSCSCLTLKLNDAESKLYDMVVKRFMGGDIYKNNVTPGTYPKWSRMHLRIWCIGRLEATVLRSLGTMFRSAPLMAFVLRQLGATVGSVVEAPALRLDVDRFGPEDREHRVGRHRRRVADDGALREVQLDALVELELPLADS